MKNRLLAFLCAGLLALCCTGLVACGSSDETPETEESAETADQASAEAEQAAAEAAAAEAAAESERVRKFLGSWQTAGYEAKDVTVTGDIAALVGPGLDMTLLVEQGGTGTFSYLEKDYPVEWHVTDDTLSIASSMEVTGEDILFGFRNRSEEDNEYISLDLTYRDESLVVDLEETERILLTQDGTIPDMPAISLDELKPIASADDLLGTWQICCVNMDGTTVYGTGTKLFSAVGIEAEDDADTTVTLAEEGAATFMGSDLEWKLDDNGLVLTDGETRLPVTSIGDDLAVDVSALTETPMVMVFAK